MVSFFTIVNRYAGVYLADGKSICRGLKTCSQAIVFHYEILSGAVLTFLGHGHRSDDARGTIHSTRKSVSPAPSGALPGNPKDAPESVEACALFERVLDPSHACAVTRELQNLEE